MPDNPKPPSARAKGGSVCAHLLAASGLWLAVAHAAAHPHAHPHAHAKEKPASAPGCAQESAQQCVTAALEAMGGREALLQVASIRLQTIGHTELMEQSYRQSPFITSY